MPTVDEIVGDLGAILSDFQGREYSGEINRETRFIQDLGFSSIDVVILGETLESHYKQQIPFGTFVSELGKQNIQDVEIGVLADFLVSHLN